MYITSYTEILLMVRKWQHRFPRSRELPAPSQPKPFPSVANCASCDDARPTAKAAFQKLRWDPEVTRDSGAGSLVCVNMYKKDRGAL